MKQDPNQSYRILEHAVVYDILKDMMAAAIEDDKERVLSLDKAYDNLTLGFYKRNPELQENYDNCRNGCVSGFGMLKHCKKDLIRDAKRRFSRISKPSLEKLARYSESR